MGEVYPLAGEVYPLTKAVLGDGRAGCAAVEVESKQGEDHATQEQCSM